MPTEEPIFEDRNAEVRRKRLAFLIAQVGGLEVVAAAAAVSGAYLDHILRRRKTSRARESDGQYKTASLGDDVAKRIEEAFGLDPGWLDWPFQAVPFRAWARLEEPDRWFVQAGFLAAIKDRIGEVQPERITVPNIPPAPARPKLGAVPSAPGAHIRHEENALRPTQRPVLKSGKRKSS